MKKSNLLEIFLSSVRSVQSTGGGTKETSYYTALNNLLDGVGHTLKPSVRCVMQLKNLGAGNPDGGLFTADQFDRKTGETKDLGKPSRGVIEVKAPAEPVDDTATTGQITKYWDRYKLVLVTNLRDWLLLGERNGQRVTLERFSLAPNEAAFWVLAAHPSKAQTEQGEAFEDFLGRVLLHNAPLADPKDLAALLASYAREARHRVEHATDAAAKQLEALQQSLESSLGVTFSADEGGHFFRSTLVQTLFYGVFSAWVLRREQAAPGQILGPFDWKSAAHSLNVPMIAALFGQLSQPAKLKALNLTEVLDWAADALNRVDQTAFFKTFESTRSIQYFYEPFLAAFDPKLRKSLGVWYTPEEIVRYQVARVDQVLQSELGLPDGLADPNVVVLDPCCGTGAYLVEVLRVIADKLKAQGADALAAHQLKLAATTRLFGFELLPAPYVVAHLQIGLLLRQLGAPLGVNADGTDERAGVFLTNALTGWEPAKDPKTQIPLYPEFELERDAADQVKQTQKIIVILGNPPYDAYGGVALGEEQDLVTPYKEGLIKKWGIKKFNLDDLYVRFFRLAERRIAEQSTRGVVCYISNFSYVSEPSFVVLREHIANNFNNIWIDNLNGDSRETGKTTPSGLPDPSVFSTPYNKEGIRKGTAVALLVKNLPVDQITQTAKSAGDVKQPETRVLYRDWWGVTKREDLLKSLNEPKRDMQYSVASPTASNRHSLRPLDVSSAYGSWPTLAELSQAYMQGMDEDRGLDLIDIDKATLVDRIKIYHDPASTERMLAEACPGLSRSSAAFVPTKARIKAIEIGYRPEWIVRFPFRPFDTRWAYYTPAGNVWKRSRPQLWLAKTHGENFLISRPSGVAKPEGVPMLWSKQVFARDSMRGHGVAFAGQNVLDCLDQDDTQGDLLEKVTDRSTANLSSFARTYLIALGSPDPDTHRDTAELIWMHALAIGYSPAYLSDNVDGIRENWPRIPLPASREALLASAELGRQVAALLDTETTVPGVTSGTIRDELKTIAVVSRVGGGALTPAEFALTAGWGSGGQGSITMPGKGKTELRVCTPDEHSAGFGTAPTLDMYLNATAYWKNIPQPVYDFTIGGYQVIKKWLSYREQRVLGRALTMGEIMEVTAMARRLAALVLLQPMLDENYRNIAAATWAFSQET
jgi:Type ISP C-terminal specificity domain/N-6 DNA Methylase